jgi:uncharacterized protein YndB with AHSA1/START domain
MQQYHNELRISCLPKAAWRALSDPAGLQEWYAPDVRVTPGLGGSIWASWGPGMEGESKITAWEPERRIAYAQEGSEVEFAIEADGEDAVRLTLNHSGLPSEEMKEWMSHPWALFMHLLKHGLENPHDTGINVTVFRYYEQPASELWKVIDRLTATHERSWNDDAGYRCLEYPLWKPSVTAIFCEQVGDKTALTIMNILYDRKEGVEEWMRANWARFADGLAAGAAAN